jgi:hypothetical protein
VADDRLLSAIIAVDVVGGQEALSELSSLAQRARAEMQALGSIQGSSKIGKDLAADLAQGEQATDRFIAALQELRTAEAASTGAGAGQQQRLRELDALIAKTQQLQRLQAVPANNPVAAAETRAQVMRDDARLRADAYGGGLAGARASDRVNAATRNVSNAQQLLDDAERKLARETEARAENSRRVQATETALAQAERELAQAIARRDAGLDAQREYNSRPGMRQREVRPGAADQLAIGAAERKIAEIKEQQYALGVQQTAIDDGILATKGRIEAAEQRRAQALDRVDLTRQAAREDEGFKINPDDVLDEARGRVAGSYDALLRAQADELAATERLEVASNRKYKDESAGTAAIAAAEAQRQAATKRLIAAQDLHAKAEREAATEVAADAERQRVAGDPRRRALLNPDGSDFLAGQGVDTTQSIRMQELAVEQQRLAASRASLIAKAQTVETEKDLAALMAQREQVERRILANTSAIERQRYTENGRGGFSGGLFGNFNGSPEGVTGRDIGFQAGQALKFYALYTGMSAVQQAISGLIRLSAEYTDAVSDLAIATNQSTEAAEEAAKTASAIGAQYGTGPIEAMQGASKFARTFRDEEQRPLAGGVESGAQIASYINILEGPQRIEKVMQDLISVMRAYGQGPEGASGVYDQAQSISQLYGYQSGEVVGGAAALADLGKESGYSLPELVALIASVMQQTGTTSDAVAGDVKRILGSQDSPEMNQAFQRFGVDLDLNFKERLDALSRVIEKLPEDERSKAITDLSADPRTGAVRAAILNAIPSARTAVEGAGDSTGLVDRQVQQRLDNLSGALKQFTANLTQTAVALGDMGITDLLTHLLQALNGVAAGVTALAGVVGMLPDPLTEAAAAAAALLLVMKAIAMTRAAFAGNTVLAGIAGRGGAAATNDLIMKQQLAAAAGSTTLARSYAAQIAASTAAGGAMARLTTSARTMAIGLASAAGSIAAAAAIGGSLWVAGDAKNRISAAEGAGNSAIAAGASLDAGIESGEPDKIRAAQAALRKQREELTKTNDGFLGVMSEWFGSKNLGFGDQSEGTLAATRNNMFEAIDKKIAEGEAAARALEIATQQLNNSSTGSDFFGNKFQRVDFGIRQIKQQGIGAAGATGALKELVEGPLDKVFSSVEGEMGAPDLVKIILDKIGRGTNPMQQQTELGELRQVVQSLAQRFSGDPVQGDQVASLLEQLNSAYLDTLISNTQAKVENLKAVSGTSGGKTGTQIRSMITAALNEATAAGDVNNIVKLLNMADKAFLDAYRKGLLAQRTALQNQLETTRAAMLASQAAAVAARAASGELTDHFTRMQDSGKGPESGKDQVALDAINKQIAALDQASKLTTFAGSAFDEPKAADDGPTRDEIEMARIASTARPGDARSQATTNLRVAQYQLRTVGKENMVEYYNALKAVKDAQYELSQVALEESKARIGAGVKPGDNYSAATAALKTAQLDLKAARDKTSYYTALKSLRDAQYELATLELERANNARLLSSDVTDPVAQARIAVQEAAAKLAFDRKRGASSSVITADQLALKQAQAAASSSAWDQGFGDMQTNYDLNRISLSAYLKYLQSQKTYLEAVKNKTRDQVEQLNQVDRALQGLAEGLQGQWNLGDIRMPTAYEMRRAAAGVGGATSTTYISVNGADTGAVLQMLQQYVGAATIQAAPTTPVKV